jgi:hypothetical protein
MIFDREEQRGIILELLSSVTIPGKALDAMYEFKQQVLKGTIQEEKKDELQPKSNKARKTPDEQPSSKPRRSRRVSHASEVSQIREDGGQGKQEAP